MAMQGNPFYVNVGTIYSNLHLKTLKLLKLGHKLVLEDLAFLDFMKDHKLRHLNNRVSVWVEVQQQSIEKARNSIPATHILDLGDLLS